MWLAVATAGLSDCVCASLTSTFVSQLSLVSHLSLEREVLQGANIKDMQWQQIAFVCNWQDGKHAAHAVEQIPLTWFVMGRMEAVLVVPQPDDEPSIIFSACADGHVLRWELDTDLNADSYKWVYPLPVAKLSACLRCSRG